MEKFTLKDFEISTEITEKLPLYYNFIKHNELLPIELEEKLLVFNKKYQAVQTGARSEKPISKIINLENLYSDR